MVIKPKQEIEIPTRSKDQRQTRHLKPSWEWVETSIWTDNMLAALDNGVKGGKWFSLIDKIYRMQTLETAWKRVRSKKGAGGVDNMTIERFEANAGKYLTELSQMLKDGTYEPQPVKRVEIFKEVGKTRPLGIPTVKDRIVQMAIKLVIEPIYERKFLPFSYGFRPGRGCRDALREVESHLKDDKVWVVDADLKSYFDTIPHDKLMERVEADIADNRVLDLIRSFLNQEIIAGCDKWTPISGSPQGAVLSPLLANIYLHELDVLMMKQGFTMVRYADDFVILCDSRDRALEALSIVQEWTTENGLTIHPEKTHIGCCLEFEQGFDFLGYRFEQGIRLVRKKSFKRLKDEIRRKTKRTNGKSLQDIIHKELNPMLIGWFGYFKWATKGVFRRIDQFIRRRLRSMLRKRNKRPGSGRTYNDHKEWPNAFFASQGLFTMETARSHWVASQSRCGN